MKLIKTRDGRMLVVNDAARTFDKDYSKERRLLDAAAQGLKPSYAKLKAVYDSTGFGDVYQCMVGIENTMRKIYKIHDNLAK